MQNYSELLLGVLSEAAEGERNEGITVGSATLSINQANDTATGTFTFPITLATNATGQLVVTAEDWTDAATPDGMTTTLPHFGALLLATVVNAAEGERNEGLTVGQVTFSVNQTNDTISGTFSLPITTSTDANGSIVTAAVDWLTATTPTGVTLVS